MRKVRIISDAVLASQYTILMIFSIVCPIVICAVDDDNSIRAVFLVLCALFLVVLLIASRRAFFLITFTPQNVQLRFPMRKKIELSYSDFPRVEHGSYLHCGIPRHYLVFSRYRFSTSELMNVNNVANCYETIKIRCTKRNCCKLISILPSSHRATVEAIMKKCYK